MRKIVTFLLISIALTSCYKDYIVDYDFDGIYFPYQQDVRSFVVGEDMKIEVGVALGGVIENTRNRNVSYILDHSLINATALKNLKSASQDYISSAAAPVEELKMLPENYYTLSDDNKMVIKKGWHNGTIVVRPDSLTFLQDSVNTVNATYALPFKIVSADADTILASKNHNIVAIKFENMLFGKYWHGGQAVIKRPELTDSIVTYPTKVGANENTVWTLSTIGPQTVYSNAYFNDFAGEKPQLKIVLKNGNVYVGAVEGASNVIIQDGACSYNNPKLLQDRKLYLKYKFVDTATNYTYHCTDTLTFRNRIRDGINEWQDENESHYE